MDFSGRNGVGATGGCDAPMECKSTAEGAQTCSGVLRPRQFLEIRVNDTVVLSAAAYVCSDARRSLTVLRADPYRSQTYRRASRTDWLGELLTTHGYHFVALDVRGTGASTGVACDEYPEHESSDVYCAAQFIA